MRYRNCDRNGKRFGWYILRVINPYIQYNPPIFHLFVCARAILFRVNKTILFICFVTTRFCRGTTDPRLPMLQSTPASLLNLNYKFLLTRHLKVITNDQY